MRNFFNHMILLAACLLCMHGIEAARMKFVEKSYLRRPTYLPGNVRRYYPEQLIDLLNATHVKELNNISSTRQNNFDELQEILESETNATENANRAEVERIKGVGDKVDKAFTKFVKKAEKQAKKLKKSAKWAAMKMTKTYAGIRSFHKKPPKKKTQTGEKEAQDAKNASDVKNAPKTGAVTTVKELAKPQPFVGTVYDKIASLADDDREKMIANISALVSSTKLGHNVTESYRKQRYAHMIRKITRVIAKLKPIFLASNAKPSEAKPNHDAEDAANGERNFANETSALQTLDKSVKGVENTHDILNDLKATIREDRKKKSK